MADFLLAHASRLYNFEYFGVIILVSGLECVISLRPAVGSLKLRWIGNIVVLILGAVTVKLVFPVVGIGFAGLCVQRGWGILNHVTVPEWLKVVVTVVLLDFVAYCRHYAAHRVAVLWRLHRLHHTDEDVDFTTTFRFHPIDGLWITTVELAAIAALGAPPVGVFITQLLNTVVDFMSHGSVRVPGGMDRFLRKFLVTPYMHRTHHSQVLRENSSNVGSLFPWWDRMFGTYIDQPEMGHERMIAGLPEFTERKHQMIHWMLAQPFLRVAHSKEPSPAETYPIS